MLSLIELERAASVLSDSLVMGRVERWLEPEILRLEAQLRQQSGAKVEDVSDAYEKAWSLAQKLGVALTGFQASVDHAQFLANAGASEQALMILNNGCEVTDTAERLPSLKVWRKLCDELRTT